MGKPVFGNNYITFEKNSFYLDKTPISNLHKCYNTPFFVFMRNKIIENIKMFENTLADVFNSYRFSYSTKANYLEEILKIISERNIPFEIISEFEYNLIKNNGLNTENLLVGGPYLPKSFINLVIKEKNPIFVIYSIDDLRKLNEIAIIKNQPKIKVILRFKSNKKNSFLGLVDDDETLQLLSKEFGKLNNLKAVGILSHYGTQLNSIEKYISNAKFISNLACKLEDLGILIPEIFNFGGGFPNASACKKTMLKMIFSAVKKTVENCGYKNITYYFEPGRFIVGDTGIAIIEIINKFPKRKLIYVNAGGYILPRFAKNAHRIYNLNRSLKNYNTPINIHGITSSDTDILAKNYNFIKDSTIGDKILVTNCGAYSLTFSNRFPYKFPQIVFVDKKSHYLIKSSVFH
jgi:diaminopimelate decarboxylase